MNSISPAPITHMMRSQGVSKSASASVASRGLHNTLLAGSSVTERAVQTMMPLARRTLMISLILQGARLEAISVSTCIK